MRSAHRERVLNDSIANLNCAIQEMLHVSNFPYGNDKKEMAGMVILIIVCDNHISIKAKCCMNMHSLIFFTVLIHNPLLSIHFLIVIKS